MLKKFFSVLLVVVLVLSLTGCQGDKDKNNNSTGSDIVSSDNTSSENVSDDNTSSNNSSSNTTNTSSNNSSVPTKTVTVEVPTKGSGLYLDTYEKIDDDTSNVKIDKKFTLKGDTTIKNELKLGKYEYVWGDEFNGNSLDTKIWSDYDSATRGSDQKITMDAITVSGGILKCTATRYYDPLNSTKKWKTAPSISTNYSMVFQHGYLEMRAKIPYKQGAWPSFWLTSGSKSPNFRNDFPNKLYDVELDVFEIINSQDTLKTTLHKWYLDGSHTILDSHKKTFFDIDTLSDEYHVYGFEWTTDTITIFLDGEALKTYDLKAIYKADKDDTKGFDQYMKIILGVGTLLSPNFQPNFEGVHLDQGDKLSELPFEYCIDWIRLYQEPGKKAIQYLS